MSEQEEQLNENKEKDTKKEVVLEEIHKDLSVMTKSPSKKKKDHEEVVMAQIEVKETAASAKLLTQPAPATIETNIDATEHLTEPTEQCKDKDQPVENLADIESKVDEASEKSPELTEKRSETWSFDEDASAVPRADTRTARLTRTLSRLFTRASRTSRNSGTEIANSGVVIMDSPVGRRHKSEYSEKSLARDSTDKPKSLSTIKYPSHRKSSEDVTVAPDNSNKFQTASSVKSLTQPIPDTVDTLEDSNGVSERLEAKKKRTELIEPDDKLATEITREVQNRMANKKQSPWSEDDEAGGLPREDSRVYRVTRALRQFICCGATGQSPSEDNISTYRDYNIDKGCCILEGKASIGPCFSSQPYRQPSGITISLPKKSVRNATSRGHGESAITMNHSGITLTLQKTSSKIIQGNPTQRGEGFKQMRNKHDNCHVC